MPWGSNTAQAESRCWFVRLDADDDVDQDDVALFETCSTGPGVPVAGHPFKEGSRLVVGYNAVVKAWGGFVTGWGRFTCRNGRSRS